MKADDYGCFFADPRLLKAHLYPLQLDTTKDNEVAKWRQECIDQGLIRTYQVKGLEYLEINDFGQQLRTKKRKYPEPPKGQTGNQNDSNLKSTRAPETETEVETEVETETEGPEAVVWDFINDFNGITGRNFKFTDKVKKQLRARLNDGYKPEHILRAVENCFNDPYHREHPHYLTPEFILRPDKLEKYANYIKPINTNTNGEPKPTANHRNRAGHSDAELIAAMARNA
jgi:uncharacterized phage protein (TIGR02220 family)